MQKISVLLICERKLLKNQQRSSFFLSTLLLLRRPSRVKSTSPLRCRGGEVESPGQLEPGLPYNSVAGSPPGFCFSPPVWAFTERAMKTFCTCPKGGASLSTH
ncbi:hypothetical protein TNIN_382991 [Trichonephila inaurata madagascariensis]|uniref:Uncharacterized protein n=1 Tax=Trichonephila inaurata madagascariensis TaxID=2747483 RepID=A0A8X6YJ76_9ARAC|nr:hypothetical protein TNIN_382991 [Trichonephila inaurata madagascariensis]